MLFDSARIDKLRTKYSGMSRFFVPELIKLDSYPWLCSERKYLESLIESVDEKIQKKWKGDFISKRNNQHLGAWFEIMLYGWLKEIGEVEIEPNFEGEIPDFCLKLGNENIFIEARAIIKSDEDRKKDALHNELRSTLEEIKKKYHIRIKKHILKDRLDTRKFIAYVNEWLDTNPDPDQEFSYVYDNDNQIYLQATLDETLECVCVYSTVEIGGLDPEKFKAPIKKKASQHKKLRASDNPYLIAVFLEELKFRPDIITRTWFGNTLVKMNKTNLEVKDITTDQKGLHYFKEEIQHTSISGTLVFKSYYDNTKGKRELKAWYIQNPFAKVNIDSSIFPVEDRYLVKAESDSRYTLGWES